MNTVCFLLLRARPMTACLLHASNELSTVQLTAVFEVHDCSLGGFNKESVRRPSGLLVQLATNPPSPQIVAYFTVVPTPPFLAKNGFISLCCLVSRVLAGEPRARVLGTHQTSSAVWSLHEASTFRSWISHT